MKQPCLSSKKCNISTPPSPAHTHTHTPKHPPCVLAVINKQRGPFAPHNAPEDKKARKTTIRGQKKKHHPPEAPGESLASHSHQLNRKSRRCIIVPSRHTRALVGGCCIDPPTPDSDPPLRPLSRGGSVDSQRVSKRPVIHPQGLI